MTQSTGTFGNSYEQHNLAGCVLYLASRAI
jgi:hypothetical protein